jgi:hypothetical protein
MRPATDVCGPETIKVLQQIFDSVWFEMKQDPAFAFADEPLLREQVSRKVMDLAHDDVLDVEGIKQKVIASFHL